MRAQAKIFAVALCALAAACGSSGNSGGTAGTSGTGGTGGTAGTGGTGGTGGTAGGGGTGGGTQTSSVRGSVMTFLALQSSAPVPNATVAVLGTNLSAKTDGSGAFRIDQVPNGERFFTVAAAGYWGSVDYWDVPQETSSGFVLYAVADADVSSMAQELGRTINAQDGVVDIYFYPAVTGASGSITPATHDPPFTLDQNGSLKVQDSVIAVGGEGDLFFTSVPANTTVTAHVQGPSGTTCHVVQSETGAYPTRAKAVTIVYASCQ